MRRALLVVSAVSAVLLASTPARAEDAKAMAMQKAVTAAFTRCASTYRQSITGKNVADHPFDCVMRAAKQAGDTDTTYGTQVTFAAANGAAQSYITSLDQEAHDAFDKPGQLGNHTVGAYLDSLASVRRAYSDSLCNLWGDIHHGGTMTSTDRAFCYAQQSDQQIDDLLKLLKEYNVIPNGR